MTQLEFARTGTVTPEMHRVAEREGLLPERIRQELAAGRLVLPANRVHLTGAGQTGVSLDPCGIGRALTTKINANIGASPLKRSREDELLKLQCAVKYGADAVMDLSTGTDLDEIREFLIAHASVPIGTVPMYSMIADKPIEQLTYDDILETIRVHAAQGVDFFTIHAGLLRKHLELVEKRQMGIVSRGGALLAKWMVHHHRENPMYEMFDEISAVMREYDVTYSLGDALRPGSLADASDDAQFAELQTLGELVQRSRSAGVQVMVEGPGHIPLDQIEMNMTRQDELCDGAPFYVLGPIVTDVFPGYDHITSAIGGAMAAYHGASFLCYVTPSEHLGLPTLDDVKTGCIACKIAAHSADIARGLDGARQWDDALSAARRRLDWDEQFRLAFDSEEARQIRCRDLPEMTDYCSMCGREWCPVRITNELQKSD